SLGDEGGFAPDLYVNAEAFDVIIEAIRKTSYQLGTDVFLSLDAAATSFYRGNGQYKIKDKPVNISSDEFVEYYADLVSQYRLLSLEDPLEEDDWDGWVTLTEKVGSQVFLVGDDLLSTNPKKLKTAIEKKAANSILIKPNQVGTLTETIEVVNLAKSHNWKTVFSHRSGETNDSFIADLAVGLGADYAKLGAPARGERVAKYNRLLSIEYELYSHH
ncbi:phosphopyruvate hydratase, partial [Candidatus Curtissbacteria bacterium]|nr:phosphopyruvate hydratase [Candidatus Curtissbacteria bacterium]